MGKSLATGLVYCPWSRTALFVKDRGVKNSHKSRSHLKILCQKGEVHNFHNEGPQILGATLQNLVASDLCTPGVGNHCDFEKIAHYLRTTFNTEIQQKFCSCEQIIILLSYILYHICNCFTTPAPSQPTPKLARTVEN